MGLRERLFLSKLQLITDIRREEGDWPEFVAAVLDAGVDLIQVRDLVAPRHDRLEALRIAIAIAADRRKAVVVGADAALAAVVGADFLHLGAADGPVDLNRQHLPSSSLVGRSVHSGGQLADAAVDPGVSYLFVGPVFCAPSPSVREVPGLDLVTEAARVLPPFASGVRPWFAVGGINLDTIDTVVAAGARRVAVSAAITRAVDPAAAVRALSDRLRAAWRRDPASQGYAEAVSGGGGNATFRLPTPPATPRA